MEMYPAPCLRGHAAQMRTPACEPGLELRPRGHSDHYAFQRIDRNLQPCHHHLPVCPLEDVPGQAPEERIQYAAFLVEAYHQVCRILLLEGMDNARGHIHVIAAHHVRPDIGRRGYHGRPLQALAPHGFPGFGAPAVIYDIQGDYAFPALRVPYHQGEVDQVLYSVRVGHRYEEPLLLLLPVLLGRGRRVLVHGETAGCALGLYRAYHASEQNHYDSPVQHIVVQEALPVFEDYLMPYQHRGKGGRRLGVAQAEHHLALVPGHPVYLLREEGSQPFAEGGHHSHHYRHLHRLSPGHKATQVYDHPDTYQEIRDEQRVADKLQAVHQRGDLRHELVEHHPHKERPQDALHPGERHQSAPEEHKRQHEDELHHSVIVLAEEPPAEDRDKEDYGGTQKGHLHHQ